MSRAFPLSPSVAAAVLGTSLTLLAGQAAEARTAVIKFTSNPRTTTSSRDFTDNGITVTADEPVGANLDRNAGFGSGGINTDLKNGICSYLKSGDPAKCQYGADGGVYLYGYTLTVDTSVEFRSFNITRGRGLSSGTITFSAPGVSDQTFSFENPSGTGQNTFPKVFAPGFFVNAFVPVTVRTTGVVISDPEGGSFRINNLEIAEVPAPLPLLGAAAAFGWSRRMRRRISQGSALQLPSQA
ncbi:MAG: hypothetical protein ACK5IA_05020 [Cyanobacteriota bacterium]|jgi:hypothetical protein